MKTAIAIAALLAGLAAAPAAAITIENYQKYRLDSRTVKATPKTLLEVRLEGVLFGLMMASRRAQEAQRKPLLCAPDGARLSGPEVVEMVEREIKSPSQGGKPYPPETAVEDVLLVAAQRRWPCPAP